jgi:4-hydroxybenzoate polyprenyltransferase
MSVAARAAEPLPLVVDLDNSLVRTDTLVEALVALAVRHPLALVPLAGALLKGRAAFKRAVMEQAPVDYARLPYDEGVLAFIRERRAGGGQVYLVTAADQKAAEAVAGDLGLFDGVVGSDGAHNLKGENKAAALKARFPGGFAYVGDSLADLPVWAEAREVLVAGGSRTVAARLAKQDLRPAKVFPRPRASLAVWVRALRLHQWTKNGLLLVPMLLAHLFLDPTVLALHLAGFVAFGLVASATYLLNDMADLAADRAHPSKAARPLAAGLIPLPQALGAALALVVVGMAAAFAVSRPFGLFTLAYAVATTIYSLRLKSQLLVDVVTIGGLFAIRILAGTVLSEQAFSLWLTSFTMILFTSLALAKRHAELVRAGARGTPVAGRGYLVSDIPLTVAVGVASAMTSVVVLTLYMQLEAAETALYQRLEPLFLMPVVLTSWLIRIWTRAHRGVLQDDPVIFALRDKVSWVHAAVIAALWLLAIT